MRALPLAAALGVALAVGSVLVAGRAQGARKAATAETVKAVPLRADAVKRLRSGDPAEIQSALDDVRISAKGGVAAVPAIVELIGRGVSPTLTQAAIDTLADIESEGASAALSWYARHRNVVLRRAAIQALARTRGPAAIKALRLGLTDPDPAVRGSSATGLGTMKAKEAIGDLFLALDHKVAESSAAIGRICAGDECDKLAAKLGSFPFEVVTSGLDQALFRAPPDVTDDIKIKIVARVRELGTAEANHFLHDVQVKWPKAGSAKVRQTIDQAVIATSGSPGERAP
ncbi:MAG: HEAT repeat domain-containing protein [Myxococcota bacterium]|nr:HEAT repeat domain-containing protein [Myxococcota bacterium]